ncbi:YciI family protein [Pirellulaceae bacterium SH467]|jgi:hypothetical protein
MRVAVLVKATPESEAGLMPDEKLMAAMTAYNEALHEAGILVSGDGLHPTSRGVRIRFSGDQRTVIDGPFAETKELVAGFWIWEVESMEHAIEWAKKCPNPMPSDSDLEIRKIFDASDFGPEFTPELQAREEQLRTELESRTRN